MRFYQWAALLGLAAEGCFNGRGSSGLCYGMQSDTVAEAVAALQRGDLADAERRLRAHPHDPDALGVLGVVLDQEKQYDQADAVYRRALELAPRSAGLLNNFGNHLLATGKSHEARPVFLKVLALDAGHANALVQLARIALEQHAPADSLRYLDRLPANSGRGAMLRMQALYALHRDAEANALLPRVEAESPSDASGAEAMGVSLASVGQYEKAAAYFERALQKDPANFEAAYRLGLAASHSGQMDQARQALRTALAQQPQNVDVLYNLAVVEAQSGNEESALPLLAQAAGSAPERADIQRLLARTASDLGYFSDAVKAWDRYAALAPQDDDARRERGFAETAEGTNTAAGLADLQWFTRRHPDNALGHYELGTAEAASDPAQALAELNRALKLNPTLAAAHVARGILHYRQGDFPSALPDFAFAAQRDPQNAAFQDRLGETLIALGRAPEALPILQEAARLAPRDSRILLHLGRALTNAGREPEAAAVLARFRELGADKSALPHSAGLLAFLNLSPEEQQARYRAGVERTVAANPGNAEAQTRYLEMLLEQGETLKAATAAQTLAGLKPSAVLLGEAADALAASGQYHALRAFVEAAGNPDSLRLDAAMAAFRLEDAAVGLAMLDRIPQAARDGDYYLARAAMSPAPEASAACTRALALLPVHPGLYSAAAMNLMRERQLPAALRLLESGAKRFPDSPELLLMQAVAMELSAKTRESTLLFKYIADRWPAWSPVWRVQAVVFESRGNLDEAWSMAQTAIAIAPGDPAIRAAATRIARARHDLAGVDEQTRAYAYIISQKPATDDVRDGVTDIDRLDTLFR